jgi:hypothetical protein
VDRHFDIIATRTLDIVGDRGYPTRQVFVHLGLPWQEPTGEWALPYQIVDLGRGTVYRVHAFDAIQAFQGVQLVIGGLLASFDEAKQGRLRWDGDPYLGFPVPPASLPDQ